MAYVSLRAIQGILCGGRGFASRLLCGLLRGGWVPFCSLGRLIGLSVRVIN